MNVGDKVQFNGMTVEVVQIKGDDIIVDNGIDCFSVDRSRLICEDDCPKSVPSVVPSQDNDVRNHNVGKSDYAKHKIQPWDIWLEYQLNPWDADIVKRVLRHKEGESRRLDYEKIIHICQERIRQIDEGLNP